MFARNRAKAEGAQNMLDMLAMIVPKLDQAMQIQEEMKCISDDLPQSKNSETLLISIEAVCAATANFGDSIDVQIGEQEDLQTKFISTAVEKMELFKRPHGRKFEYTQIYGSNNRTKKRVANNNTPPGVNVGDRNSKRSRVPMLAALRGKLENFGDFSATIT
jgi:hypothetical protein